VNNEDFMKLVLDKLTALEQGQTETNKQIASLKEETNEQIASLTAETTRIRQSVAVIEIEHGKSLGALHDGYKLVYDKLKPLPEAVEILQDDVSVIKAVVTSHSKDINTLKVAK